MSLLREWREPRILSSINCLLLGGTEELPQHLLYLYIQYHQSFYISCHCCDYCKKSCSFFEHSLVVFFPKSSACFPEPRRAWVKLQEPLRTNWGIQTPQQLWQLPQKMLVKVLDTTPCSDLTARDTRFHFIREKKGRKITSNRFDPVRPRCFLLSIHAYNIRIIYIYICNICIVDIVCNYIMCD